MRFLLSIVIATAAVPALAADFLHFAYARTSVTGTQCPNARYDRAEGSTPQEAKDKLKYILKDPKLVQETQVAAKRPDIAIIYSYLGNISTSPCHFTEYGMVSARTTELALVAMKEQTKDKKYYLSEPVVVEVWSGQLLKK